MIDLDYAYLFTIIGLVYTYLAGHVGRAGEGAFRALTRGYTHWASGRLQELQVNTNNPLYCHVQCVMSPSMRAGTYRVYLLLGKRGILPPFAQQSVIVLLGKFLNSHYSSTGL